jgi:membrane protease YdiL (CAAX protease family)
VDLAGAVIALVLLLFSLPLRLRRVWGEAHPWRRLGLAADSPGSGAGGLLLGVLVAGGLLAPVAALLLLSGQAQWRGALSPSLLANGLALLLGVGFAEELLFRGWLWGELELLLPRRRALGLQALLFALVHPWHRLPPLPGLALLGGLTLLGLALALLRRQLNGNLWGSIGLHGGLVGGCLHATGEGRIHGHTGADSGLHRPSAKMPVNSSPAAALTIASIPPVPERVPIVNQPWRPLVAMGSSLRGPSQACRRVPAAKPGGRRPVSVHAQEAPASSQLAPSGTTAQRVILPSSCCDPISIPPASCPVGPAGVASM